MRSYSRFREKLSRKTEPDSVVIQRKQIATCQLPKKATDYSNIHKRIEKIDGPQSHGIIGLSNTENSVTKCNFTTQRYAKKVNLINDDSTINVKSLKVIDIYEKVVNDFECSLEDSVNDNLVAYIKRKDEAGLVFKEVPKTYMVDSIQKTNRPDFPEIEPEIVELLKIYEKEVFNNSELEEKELMVDVTVYSDEGVVLKCEERRLSTLIDRKKLQVFNDSDQIQRFEETFELLEIKSNENQKSDGELVLEISKDVNDDL